MDISRRELLSGSALAITSLSLGFASGMAFEEALDEDGVQQQPGNGSTGNGGGEETPTETPEEGLPLSPDLTERPKIGSEDAPVKMVYYNDYQCPFCARFDRQTMPDIMSNFVENGTLQLILKPLHVFGEGSRRAAVSAHCVYHMDGVDQATFLAWHNRLYTEFENSEGRNSGWATVENLVSYAGTTEAVSAVQKNALRTCLYEENYLDYVEQDRAESNQLGMQGTPFFMIYNPSSEEYQLITGAQPYEQFASAIESVANEN